MIARIPLKCLAPILGIVGVAVYVCWNEVRLSALRNEQDGLFVEARSLGVIHATGRFRNAPLPTKSRQRIARDNIQRQGVDIINLVLRIQNADFEGRTDDLETQKMKNSLNASLLDLSAAQVVALIHALNHAGEIALLERERLAAFALQMLLHNDPDGMIEIILRPDLLTPEHIRTRAFHVWARRDPDAVISWMEKHRDSRPDLVNEDTKKAVIYEVSAHDPGLGFRLLSRLSPERPWFVARSIGMQSKTAVLRDAAINGLREYLASTDDPYAQKETARLAYAGFAHSLKSEGFEAATNWLLNANLAEGEYFGIINHIGFQETRRNHAKWIEWMGANLPPDLRTDRIHAIMSGWTASNHQEAGNWLVRAPDTPGKDLAVRTYVVMVAPIDPGISEQWAMTLPPGANRDELLKEVHRKWPKELELEKEAFAARHGIK